MKIAVAPSSASEAPATARDAVADGMGRDRVATSLLTDGPATASMLAERLSISATAVRRHLDTLGAAGWVEGTERPPYGPTPTRGRGRPARTFALTPTGRAQFRADYDDLAAHALSFVGEVGGEAAIESFAELRAQQLEERLRALLGDDWRSAEDSAQVAAVADALTSLGFATSVEPAHTGVQLCQHHCPVAHVATQFPQLCEAETAAFARVLGHHVQRLATIAHGDGVCTTVIPLDLPSAPPTPSGSTPTERTSA